MKPTNRQIICTLFTKAAQCEFLSQVQAIAHKQGVKIQRQELIDLLSDEKHRENVVAGSQFDLVQQKIKIEVELDMQLRQAKKKGLSWPEARFQLHISPGEDYARLKKLFLQHI